MNTRFAPASQPAPVLTLHELIEAIGRIALLSSTRKRDLISAVSCMCKMGQVSPQHFAVSPRSVRQLVASIEPAAHGISAKSYGNIQSNLRAALAIVGVIDSMPRGAARSNPAWSALIDAVENDKSLAYGLVRFVNFCASRTIAPDHVSEKTVSAYLEWLRTRTIDPDPEREARRTGRLWNRARDRVKAWPRYRMPKVGAGLAERKTTMGGPAGRFSQGCRGLSRSASQPRPVRRAAEYRHTPGRRQHAASAKGVHSARL